MGYDITPQRVEEMRRFLLEHPLDPDYDENVIELEWGLLCRPAQISFILCHFEGVGQATKDRIRPKPRCICTVVFSCLHPAARGRGGLFYCPAAGLTSRADRRRRPPEQAYLKDRKEKNDENRGT